MGCLGTFSMSDDADLIGLDELPDDARAVVDAAERAVSAVRDRAAREAAEIRAAADRECDAVRVRAEAELAAVQQTATRELAPLVRGLLDRLRELQQRYTREGLLDEALAIRARVRQIRGDLLGVRPDPGTLAEFSTTDIGRTVLFDVVGRADGSAWGTDVYTADSRLASAAVHTGVVREGERGLVRVVILDGAEQMFTGSERNGVATFDYGNYPVAYRIEKV
ncbi:hypothetical protein FTUN_3348 [Frigoriglobus tundricola]|uniref:LCCL domain-containing protein n=2 Tax=Frigoriglobus tundricola TaxID=2774151 RepID=A0A6M5YQM7_9BACT|nr:hypothetical protein FTUN_3348 [Frigoriglobus tundricola]